MRVLLNKKLTSKKKKVLFLPFTKRLAMVLEENILKILLLLLLSSSICYSYILFRIM